MNEQGALNDHRDQYGIIRALKDANGIPRCPRCGGAVPNDEQPGAYEGALSRSDNMTEICSRCGGDEAMAGTERPAADLESEHPYDQQRLLQLLGQMGLDIDGSESDFCDMTAAEMRTLIDEGYLKLDDYVNENHQVSYLLGVMDRVGEVTAYGELYVGSDGLSLEIEGLDVHGTDTARQVHFLLETYGADEAYRIASGAIRVWWD